MGEWAWMRWQKTDAAACVSAGKLASETGAASLVRPQREKARVEENATGFHRPPELVTVK